MIQLLIKNSIITAFPNPTLGNFEITNLNNLNNVIAAIHDIKGRLVSKKEYNVVNRKITLSLGSEVKGIYSVKLDSNKKIVKIVKY